jgi:hypothetical protein
MMDRPPKSDTDRSSRADVLEPEDTERLRAQVESLQRELAVQAARTNAVVADAQRRTYWLDRLNLDLDVTLGRPLIRLALLGALGTVRLLRRLRGRVRRLRSR